MKKKLLAVVLCLAMALSAAACGGGAGDSAEPAADETTENGASSETAADEAGSNTVVIAMGSGFSTLDPGYVYEKYPPLIMNACYENLFKFYTNDGAPEPCLADTYEFSEDGLTLTVNLKQDVTFASGNKMTSADVAFSINRCKNLQGNPAFICDTIESIETPDEYTVVFHLTQPDSAFLSKLTYCSLAVLDSQVVKENGGTDAEDAATADTAQSYLNTTSAGSGMYVMTSYIPDQEVVLEKNPNYWGEATNVDKYIIQIQPDSNTQMMTLSTGDIDVAMNMTDDTMAELEGALNYENFQVICGEGSTTPYSLIQSGFMGSKGERTADYTNVEEAKELLAQAGYPDGFDIDLTVCDLDMEGILLSDLAQLVKSDLAQIGINVNIVAEPWAAGYGDAYRDGTLGFTIMYWATDYNDPNVQLEFLPGASVGVRAGWTAEMDPELAAMYEEALSATDNDARIAVLEKIQDAMYEDGPFVFVVQAPAHIAYNDRLDGVAISDPYSLDLTLINVK